MAGRESTILSGGGPDYYALQKIQKDVTRKVKGQRFDDCEWHATFKKIELDKLGASSEMVYVSTNGDEKSPNHVVLKVGDYYLDNRHRNPITEKQMRNGGYRVFPGYKPGDGLKRGG